MSKSPEGWLVAAGLSVRALRLAAGLTLEDVAEQANVSEKTVRRVERGQVWPTLRVRTGLAQALGLEVERLTATLLGSEQRS